MKTKELLDKYKKILAGLLKEDESSIKFYVRKNGVRQEIGEVEYEKKDKPNPQDYTYDWSNGSYEVKIEKGKAGSGRLISMFELYEMPHCCGILVSCKAFVNPDFRGKRVGSTLNSLRQDIGRLMGYSLMFCTDIDQNENQRKLLRTQGWKDLYKFINKRTSNIVHLSIIDI